MSEWITKTKKACLDEKYSIVEENIEKCQKEASTPQQLFDVYWMMAKLYQQNKLEDAAVGCALRCRKLMKQNQLEYDFYMSEFIDHLTNFIEEKYMMIRKRLLTISVTAGFVTFMFSYFVLQGGFLVSFILMNVVSVGLFTMTFDRTCGKFDNKQFNACKDFMNERDQKFSEQHY